MKSKLNKYYRNTPDQELLDDLKRVVNEFNTSKMTRSDYDEKGKFSAKSIEERFGSWTKALEKAGLIITERHKLSDKELFQNIEELWIQLGRQPLYIDLKAPLSKYTKSPYERIFGKWKKAVEAYVEFIEEEDENVPETEENNNEVSQANNEIAFKHKTERYPSGRLKVKVLMRDGNKCRVCGATVTGENIHFDHIIPWDKGGETVLENIQILCATHCNEQ